MSELTKRLTAQLVEEYLLTADLEWREATRDRLSSIGHGVSPSFTVTLGGGENVHIGRSWNRTGDATNSIYVSVMASNGDNTITSATFAEDEPAYALLAHVQDQVLAPRLQALLEALK